MFRRLRLIFISVAALAAGFAAFVWLAPGKNHGMRYFLLRFYGVLPAITLTWNDYEIHSSIEDQVSQESLTFWLALKTFDRYNSEAPYSFLVDVDRVIPRIERPFRTWRWQSFLLSHGDFDANAPLIHRETRLEFPCWFAVTGLSAYPLVAFFRGPARRWHRRRHGRCVKCAYDLTGLPEPRCPECGERVEVEGEAVDRGRVGTEK